MEQSKVLLPAFEQSSLSVSNVSTTMTPTISTNDLQTDESKSPEVPTDMSKLWEQENRKNGTVVVIIPERPEPFSPPSADRILANPNAVKIQNKIKSFYGKRQSAKRFDLAHLLE